MQIPVLVQPAENNGYRAHSGEPLPLIAEGATREEALQKLRQLLDGQLRNGTELVSLEVQAEDNPWVTFAGMFKDHPMFEEVTQIMADNRRKDDVDPDYL